MATVVLQVVGAAIGGAIGGPAGAAIGRAIGAAAGYAVDQRLLSKDQVVRGGRLEDSRILTSTTGTAIPRLYGRVRIGGQLIWATRFQEVRTVKKKGGKGGGPSVKSESYTYFGNFAIGICEGEISHIGRIWADGKEIDQTKFEIRKYSGSENQTPDPLIEVKQGFGKAPAYRGTAYVVFESFPLADFGNRIPQISFEIIRSIGDMENNIKSVSIIPGATEFGYFPSSSPSALGGGNASLGSSIASSIRHNFVAETDWEASLDELQALCPNLKTVSLVVAWFGTDLRAGHCKIEPRVTFNNSNLGAWKVSGLNRHQVNQVSRHEDVPAYGGTPSDASLVAAIQDLKARGLKVTLYPFIMMDIEVENELADPYGENQQAAYPWRGRITSDVARDLPNTSDQTTDARNQINQFLGSCDISEFSLANNGVIYSGDAELSYRRMILHYAHLCELAGGVDTFLIGSEMKGLTSVRDDVGSFPFVEGLQQLADDCRSVLNTATKISYAADWSEYFGFHPASASNDLYFNLDPLWASPSIDAVSIDNYMPIANWSGEDDPTMPDYNSIFDLQYLQANIQGGEGIDWYYASQADRLDQVQTPITDGMGEKWVWSYKDLPAWWSNPHHERLNGVRSTTPTAWIPQSKPIWFTELGCPAIDRGANQPNVFVDAKSSENRLPWFSRGGRDDLMQRRFNEAHLEFWSEDFLDAATVNPLSSLNSERMVSTENITLWTWDARPFPAFPTLQEEWSDGRNWHRSHWLNGRFGTCDLSNLISAIFADFEIPAPVCQVDGLVQGFVISGESSARSMLEPLLAVHNIAVSEEEGRLIFRSKAYCDEMNIQLDELIQEDSQTKLSQTRQSEIELPREIILAHADIDSEFDTVTSSSKRLETVSDRQMKMQLPAVLSRDKASTLANARLRDFWLARDSTKFQLPWKYLKIAQGDVIGIDQGTKFQISNITDGIGREMEGLGFSRFEESLPWIEPSPLVPTIETRTSQPNILLMNLPLEQDSIDPKPRIYIAANSVPWAGEYAVFSSPLDTGYERLGSIYDQSIMFEILSDLPAGPLGRWDYGSFLELSLFDPNDEFESLERPLVFAGGNPLAVQSSNGGWEVIQFQKAEMISDGVWRLKNLLRGQLGTDHEMLSGIQSGAHGVFLDATISPFYVAQNQVGLQTNWKIGPVGTDLSSPLFVQLGETCDWINKRPMRPCHLASSDVPGATHFTWVRRSRINGDNWENAEVPLDFGLERYEVRIEDLAGAVLGTETVTEPSFDYPDSQRLADLGSLQTNYLVKIAQLSDAGLPGPAISLQLQF